MDDDGAARLAIGSRTIVIVLTKHLTQESYEGFRPGENFSSPRYRAPELNWPEEYGVEKPDKVTATKESDVYEMAMATYKASPNCLISYLRSKPCVGLLPGLDGQNAVLQMSRYRGVGKDPERGTSAKTIGDRRRCLGFSSEMLEQEP